MRLPPRCRAGHLIEDIAAQQAHVARLQRRVQDCSDRADRSKPAAQMKRTGAELVGVAVELDVAESVLRAMQRQRRDTVAANRQSCAPIWRSHRGIDPARAGREVPGGDECGAS